MTAQSQLMNPAGLLAEKDEWETIYLREMPRIYNFFFYRLQDKHLAEDLTAVTFEKAWRQRDRYRPKRGAISTWLFTIAKNVAIDYYRRQNEETTLNDALPAPNPSPEETVQYQENLAQLRRLLYTLSGRDQEIIALKYGAGLSNRDIARVTNLSAAHVGIILFRTVRRLRCLWNQPELGENQ